ncbi:hypothetical protein FOZ63_015006, partial [Perkinsus olseni]
KCPPFDPTLVFAGDHSLLEAVRRVQIRARTTGKSRRKGNRKCFHYPAAADYALGRDLRLDRLQTQQQAVEKHIAAQSRNIRLLFQGGQALASLVSSDNDILSDLIAVSKGHSPGDGTQMENTLSSVVTDFVIRHEIDASDLSCSRKYDSLCSIGQM